MNNKGKYIKKIILIISFVFAFAMIACSGNEESEEKKHTKQEEEKDSQPEEVKEITTIEELNADKFVAVKENKEYKYYEYENHIEIVKYLGEDTKIEIPEKIDGIKVLRISGFGCPESGYIDELVIPEGVLSIVNSGEFENLFGGYDVKNIIIPKSVKEISASSILHTEWYFNLEDEFCVVGDGILIKCNIQDNDMEHLEFPKGIKKISAYGWSFLGVGELKWKYCDGGVGSDKVREITIPDGCTEIDVKYDTLFNQNIENVEKINIPDTVKNINRDCFTYTAWWENNKDEYMIVGNGVLVKYNKSSTESNIEIPEDINCVACTMEIDNRKAKIVFPKELESLDIRIESDYGCEFVFPENVKKTFKVDWYLSLTADEVYSENIVLKIPNYNSKIDSLSFRNCYAEQLIIDEGIRIICCGAFESGNIKYVDIPSTCTTIDENAFCGCLDLSYVSLPKSVEYIGDSAFASCESLVKIDISSNAKYIGDGAFYRCGKLKNISIPEGVTYIGAGAFQGCNNITSITVPKSVTYIGDDAFKTQEESWKGKDELSGMDVTYIIFHNISEIRGFKGSYAETYAKENDIKFVIIDEE